MKTLELGTGLRGYGCGYKAPPAGSEDSRCSASGVLAGGGTITYHGATYKVHMVQVAYAGGTLQLILDREPKDSDGSTTDASHLILIVDGREFAFAGARVSQQPTPDSAPPGSYGNKASWWSLHWTGTGLDWVDGASVSLSLVTPPVSERRQPPAPPPTPTLTPAPVPQSCDYLEHTHALPNGEVRKHWHRGHEYPGGGGCYYHMTELIEGVPPHHHN